MGNKIIIQKMQKHTIFAKDFESMHSNNIIQFKKLSSRESSKQGIAVIYGPNGTGKTTLGSILNGTDASGEFKLKYNGKVLMENNDLFHLISDQNGRNIIKGEAEEFLLGTEIARERKLKKYIDDEFNRVYEVELNTEFKNKFLMTTISHPLLNYIDDVDINYFTSLIVNRSNRGKDIDKDKFLLKCKTIDTVDIKKSDNYDEKMKYLITYMNDKESALFKTLKYKPKEIKIVPKVVEIQENSEAIKILKKFDYKSDCIVCDNMDFNRVELLKKKSSNKDIILNNLDKKVQSILESLAKQVDEENDPFRIKKSILNSVSNGNLEIFSLLVAEIHNHIKYSVIELMNIYSKLDLTNLSKSMTEYKTLLSKKPVLEEEDEHFIKQIIDEYVKKELIIERDSQNKNDFIIRLGSKKLTETDRGKLELSSGEQNFISLAFELLRARKSKADIIILDDPISSFDSVYKNKIIFCVVKFLNRKKQLILTHNTDLIRLIEHQVKGGYNLYIFNNNEDEKNGFIPVKYNEIKILLEISELIKLLRNKPKDNKQFMTEILNEKLFLISLVPFMRSFSNIIDKPLRYKQLSKIMHGYESKCIDIRKVYKSLFGCGIEFQDNHCYSVQDILSVDIANIKILKDSTPYELLNDALKHTLVYLYLRLLVEVKLVEKFSVKIEPKKIYSLQKIIDLAFANAKKIEQNKNLSEDELKLRIDELNNYRVFLLSRKTLLNEFNHFEGNMNIFQPAIDITNSVLNHEIMKIHEYIGKIMNY